MEGKLGKILIIEDEEALVEALKYTLTKEGFSVQIAVNGTKGLDIWEREGADLIILDLMLPELDGLEVCKRVRMKSDVPILILTAKDSEVDEILGLELGADDYVTKPFNMRKLIARVRALMRRSLKPIRGSERMRAGNVILDSEKCEVEKEGKKVPLTPLEYRILEFMMRNKGKALTREQILARVWPDGFYGSPKTLDVHIRHLREKIENDPSSPRTILTVRGHGYRIEDR